MERLRIDDGTKVHRDAASYHLGACRRSRTAFHEALGVAIEGCYLALVADKRAVEDAEDARQQTLAEVHAAEIDLENGIRDLDGELGKLDRADGTLNARRTVFPEGFGKVIKRQGAAQLGVLPGLRARLSGFLVHPAVAARAGALDAMEAAFKAALQADEMSLGAIALRKAHLESACRAVREQLDSAYGQLRSYYKARPGMADRFFLRNLRRRKKAKKAPEVPAPSPEEEVTSTSSSDVPAPGSPASSHVALVNSAGSPASSHVELVNSGAPLGVSPREAPAPGSPGPSRVELLNSKAARGERVEPVMSRMEAERGEVPGVAPERLATSCVTLERLVTSCVTPERLATSGVVRERPVTSCRAMQRPGTSCGAVQRPVTVLVEGATPSVRPSVPEGFAVLHMDVRRGDMASPQSSATS
ncbi:hypothetical protein [Chondromyces crocatus]|uniref:Uncharacterized protein n=1 Tax=Chondromyces crocatus TaxID=52 RepID=A0A0K1ELA5_CHOCO|nr:hypothetical protein [Chondromyces crocatus]AKT41664.1 uncharacterized protein CMC5_058700 [Chondromyces crocatus]